MWYTFRMSEKARRIIAIIALVFMGIFSISIVLYLLDKNMLGGVVALVTLISGGIGFFLFLMVKLMKGKDNYDEIQEESDDESENDNSEQNETQE